MKNHVKLPHKAPKRHLHHDRDESITYSIIIARHGQPAWPWECVKLIKAGVPARVWCSQLAAHFRSSCFTHCRRLCSSRKVPGSRKHYPQRFPCLILTLRQSLCTVTNLVVPLIVCILFRILSGCRSMNSFLKRSNNVVPIF